MLVVNIVDFPMARYLSMSEKIEICSEDSKHDNHL